MKSLISTQRNQLTVLLFAVCAVMLIASGCKKDNTTKSGSNSALFSGAWKLTKFEIKGADSVWVEATPPLLLTEYTYTFKSDGTYIMSSDGIQAATSYYTVYDNFQSMDMGSITYHISVLNSNELQLIDSNENFPYSVNGVTATYYGERDTYTH